MRTFLGAAIGAALFGLSVPGPAQAQDVTLRSFDGAIELSGELIGFDGEFYRVESIYGPITVSAQGVQCAGPGCPGLDAFVAEARFAGAAVMADILMPALIEAFARDRGMTLAREIDARGRSTFVLTREADRSVAARFTVAPGTTEDGITALLNREADLALALREISGVEQRAARTADQGEVALAGRVRVLAIDGLVPVVAQVSVTDRISMADLARVFAGEIDNWQDLGGPDAPIALHLMDAASGISQGLSLIHI